MRLLPLVLLAACGDPEPAAGPPEVDECGRGGESRVVVLRSMSFVRAEGEVSDGFDLDGEQSACGVADFTSPDGASSIDNAFAYLLPALELTEAAAVEALIQQAIDTGLLLITLELDGLHDELDDACVDLSVARASGPPMLGTDGRLLWGQTLDRDLQAPAYDAGTVELIDGVLEADAALELPVSIFGVDLQFDLLGGRMRAELHPDGSVTGLFGGGVDVAYVLQVAQEENVDPALHGILEALLDQWADLAPDETGACTQVSVGIRFEAVPAFYFE